jgi:hypothetical protein
VVLQAGAHDEDHADDGEDREDVEDGPTAWSAAETG